jgi:hypothetical protein
VRGRGCAVDTTGRAALANFKFNFNPNISINLKPSFGVLIPCRQPGRR